MSITSRSEPRSARSGVRFAIVAASAVMIATLLPAIPASAGPYPSSGYYYANCPSPRTFQGRANFSSAISGSGNQMDAWNSAGTGYLSGSYGSGLHFLVTPHRTGKWNAYAVVSASNVSTLCEI